MDAESREDRFVGCLLGLAVGDAMGASVEFMAPGTFEPVTDMRGGGPHGLKPGEWTDDTSMALCLAASLLESGSFDAADQMERYVRWWRQGYMSSTGRCFDIGMTIRRALLSFEQTGEPYSGSTDPRTAGNGSIMRLAPVAMAYSNDVAKALARCAKSSRTTHGASEAVDACSYFGALLVGLLNGADKTDVLAPRYFDRVLECVEEACTEPPAASDLAPALSAIAGGSFREREPPEIKGSGYVVQSLEAALWAFNKAAGFREGCLLAVNLGDDADTTGAVFGQLAGACYGATDIPEEWLATLAWRDRIEELALRLERFSRTRAHR